jgi:hypothetical protein
VFRARAINCNPLVEGTAPVFFNCSMIEVIVGEAVRRRDGVSDSLRDGDGVKSVDDGVTVVRMDMAKNAWPPMKLASSRVS